MSDSGNREENGSNETARDTFMSLDSIKARYFILRSDLVSFAGADLSSQILKELPSDLNDRNEVEIRTYYETLREQVERYDQLRQNFDQVRTGVTAAATSLAVCFFLIIVYYVYVATKQIAGGGPLFAVTLIVLSGMLGGCVSALAQLYSLRWNVEFSIEASSKSRMLINLILNFVQSILLSAVFSLVLYLAFISNIIDGQIFPDFRPEAAEPKDNWQYFHYYLEHAPANHANYAKALLWAFAAGFSERLIPDFISTLTPSVTTSLGSRTTSEARTSG